MIELRLRSFDYKIIFLTSPLLHSRFFLLIILEFLITERKFRLKCLEFLLPSTNVALADSIDTFIFPRGTLLL